MPDVTQILVAAAGDPQAAADLLPLVYDELRALAAARMAAERPGQTLQATALVHEAYLRLVGGGPAGGWDGHGHFFAAAAWPRRVLVDHARRRATGRRGGGRGRAALDPADLPADPGDWPPDDLLALDDALAQLAAEDSRKARLVEFRLFAGLSAGDAAAALGVSEATAKRDWVFARAFLAGRLRPAD